jgi:hypothetical protein
VRADAGLLRDAVRRCDLRRDGRDLRRALLLLQCGPVEIGVFARHSTIGDGEDVYPIAHEKLSLNGGSTHLVLAHEVSVSDVHSLPFEADIGPLGQYGRNGLARGGTADRRLATAMEMEHGVVGVHRDDRVHVAPRPRGPVTNSQILNLSPHGDLPFEGQITKTVQRFRAIGVRVCRTTRIGEPNWRHLLVT